MRDTSAMRGAQLALHSPLRNTQTSALPSYVAAHRSTRMAPPPPGIPYSRAGGGWSRSRRRITLLDAVRGSKSRTTTWRPTRSQRCCRAA